MNNRFRRMPCAVLLAIASVSATAAQNDPLPTDLIALPDGALNVSVYAVHQELSGKWTNGVRTQQQEGSTNLFALRFSKHFSVGDRGQYTLAPIAVLTGADCEMTSLQTGAMTRTRGVGDLRLGASFWFHADRENREYGMVGLLASLPTGDYDPNGSLNVGENRRKYVLAGGWMQPIGQRWVLDLMPEVAFFGDNNEYLGTSRRSQSTAYAMTGTLRYKMNPTVHVYGSAQINRGGDASVQSQSGLTYYGAPDNTRIALGTLIVTGSSSHIQIRYAQDTQVQNGYRNTGELALRWSGVFR